jgi:DNA-binding NarL/FixJ family response regulator
VNSAVYDAALRAGLSSRDAQIFAVYVESDKIAAAAKKLGVAESTVKNALSRVYIRLEAPHAAGALVKLLT